MLLLPCCVSIWILEHSVLNYFTLDSRIVLSWPVVDFIADYT